MKDLTEALQADAGFCSMHLTGQQWLRSRSRVCLWFLELNSVTKHPASLTFCPFEPCRKTFPQMYNNIKKKKTTTPQKNCIQFWKPICWSTHFVETFSMCGRVCSQLNNRILCIADSNSEEARKDTLSYSAWKRREGRPESFCPGGKLIQRRHFLKKQLASNLNIYCSF